MIPVPPFRLVTAPSDAQVTSVVPPGATVAAGDVIAVLDAPRGSISLLAPVRGRVGGALADARQRVASGDAIVWLEG